MALRGPGGPWGPMGRTSCQKNNARIPTKKKCALLPEKKSTPGKKKCAFLDFVYVWILSDFSECLDLFTCFRNSFFGFFVFLQICCIYWFLGFEVLLDFCWFSINLIENHIILWGNWAGIKGGNLQNMFRYHFDLKTTIKSQNLDLNPDFQTFRLL